MYGHVCETGVTREVPPCLPLNVSRLRIHFQYQSQDRSTLWAFWPRLQHTQQGCYHVADVRCALFILLKAKHIAQRAHDDCFCPFLSILCSSRTSLLPGVWNLHRNIRARVLVLALFPIPTEGQARVLAAQNIYLPLQGLHVDPQARALMCVCLWDSTLALCQGNSSAIQSCHGAHICFTVPSLRYPIPLHTI